MPGEQLKRNARLSMISTGGQQKASVKFTSLPSVHASAGEALQDPGTSAHCARSLSLTVFPALMKELEFAENVQGSLHQNPHLQQQRHH